MRNILMIITVVLVGANVGCGLSLSSEKAFKGASIDGLAQSHNCTADMKALSETKEKIAQITIEMSHLSLSDRLDMSRKLLVEQSKLGLLEVRTRGCIDKNAFYSLRVEKTQGVQVFDWKGECKAFSVEPIEDDACGDNAIPMVDGKPTALRVYFDFPENMSWDLSSVDGVITFDGENGSTVSIPSHNGPLERSSMGGVLRSQTNGSLNFRIPGYHSTGDKWVTLTIFDASHPDDDTWRYSMAMRLHFDKIVVPVRGVMVRLIPYPGANFDEPLIGSRDDLIAAIDRVRKFIPARLDVVGIDEVDVDVVKELGGRDIPINPALWDVVTSAVEREYSNSGKKAVFIGFYKSPSNIYASTRGLEGWSECGSYGAFVSSASGTRMTESLYAAHEFGHILNAKHSDQHPYPSVNGSSLTIYSEGFDVERMEVVARNNFDVMRSVVPSNAWVSPFNYEIMRKCLIQAR